MAEIIYVRVMVFALAFFLLRPVMFMLIERPKRSHALGLLGVSTLIAFVTGAVVLDDSIGDSLVAWFVIYGIIAFLWALRWKGADNEERWRSERRAWDEARRQARAQDADS